MEDLQGGEVEKQETAGCTESLASCQIGRGGEMASLGTEM